jgi:hypothetical protein
MVVVPVVETDSSENLIDQKSGFSGFLMVEKDADDGDNLVSVCATTCPRARTTVAGSLLKNIGEISLEKIRQGKIVERLHGRKRKQLKMLSTEREVEAWDSQEAK